MCGKEALGWALPEDAFGELVWKQQVARVMALDGLKPTSPEAGLDEDAEGHWGGKCSEPD